MKKIMALLLGAVILLGIFSGCGSAHKHCVCGGGLAGHSCEKIEWTALSQSDFDDVTEESSPVSVYNNVFLLTSGSYYLEEDIVTTEQILVIGDTVDLCLNGKRMAGTYSLRTGNFSRIFAVSGGTLNISDCCASEGTGNIQGSYVGQGGAILIQGRSGGAEGDLGTVNLYSGTVKGGRAQSTNGGTVSITGGTFNVYGGNITGGAANKLGGNVYVGSGQNLNLYGGTLTNGAADAGSCVYASAESNVTVGGTANVAQIWLENGAKLAVAADKAPAAGFSAGIGMEVPGVFAENISTDLSAFFTGGTVTYDPSGRTLSLEG